MANTFFGLTIASSGLNAANVAINTSAHNISNINTKGYTKQQTVQEASGAIRVYSTYGTVSTGVTVSSIEQLRSSYYDTKFMNANTNYNEYATYENYTALIEDYLDEFNLDGFMKEYANLFDAIDDLTLTPDSVTARTLFLNYSSSICDYFNTLSTNLSNVQKQANDEVKTTVDSINSIAERVASLNKQINTIEIAGGQANDLRDARAKLLDELSGYINTSFSETPIGNGANEFKVYINSQALVDGYDFNRLVCTARETGNRRNASDLEGLYDIGWNNGLPFNMFSSSLSGSLKAAIDIVNGNNEAYEVRTLRQYDETTDTFSYLYQGEDASGNLHYGTQAALEAAGYKDVHYANVNDMDATTLNGYLAGGMEETLKSYESPYFNSDYKGVPFYQAQINAFAQSFADSFNHIIQKGDVDNDGADGDDVVQNLFTAKFEAGYVSAANIQVNPNMILDLKLLPISYDRTVGAANTDMVMDLAAIKSKFAINNGTYEDYLSSIVSVIAIDAGSSKSFAKTYQTIQQTIENQRTSVSGVDEDEEAVDLVRFQNAYNLSSKVISVMQEIYRKLIEQTGL